jgi:drug/metabolite transporter (DMT)-like permease
MPTLCIWEEGMPVSAFLLVLFAAIAHSSWNFLLKSAVQSRHLIWFSSLGETILFLPVALWTLEQAGWRLSLTAGAFLLVTGILNLFYTECLQRAYCAGDLSVVYPLARGTGPLLSFFGAVLALHEHPSRVAVVGALLVSFGILSLSSAKPGPQSRMFSGGLFWGALTGLIIACYTVTDGYLVKMLMLSPILVDYGGNFFRTIALSSRAWRERGTLRQEYRCHWREALGISVLAPIGYILVLFAMRIAPVSRVAPVREMSMIIGAYLGTKLLNEGHGLRRIIGTAVIACGVAALTLG